MSTTIATPTPNRRPRRALLTVTLATALAVGAGAATVSLTSSGSTAASSPTHPESTVAPNVNVPALWDRLATLPAGDQRIVVAALEPSVRAELRAVTEAMGATALSH